MAGGECLGVTLTSAEKDGSSDLAINNASNLLNRSDHLRSKAEILSSALEEADFLAFEVGLSFLAFFSGGIDVEGEATDSPTAPMTETLAGSTRAISSVGVGLSKRLASLFSFLIL